MAADETKQGEQDQEAPKQDSGTQSGPPGGRGNQRREAERMIIPPFTVECGDYKASGFITIDTPPIQQRLRGRWERSKVRGEGGVAAKLPDPLPGIQLRVFPRDNKVVIYDPLTDDKDLREAIERANNSDEDVTIRDASGFKCGAWPTVEHELDQHQMKTLLLEIARKVLRTSDTKPEQIEKKCLILIKGAVPDEKELAAYPGRELYDVWSKNPRKPKFKDQAEAYEENLERAGELVR